MSGMDEEFTSTSTISEPFLMKSGPTAVEVNPIISRSTFNWGIPGYRDPLFLFLFIANLFYVATLAISYGGVALANTGSDYWIITSTDPSSSISMNPDGTDYSEVAYEGNYHVPTKLLAGLVLIILSSATISMTWIYFLSKIAHYVMNTMIVAIVVASSLGGFTFLFMGYSPLGLLLILVAMSTLILALYHQARIDFAAKNLQIACEAIVTVPSTLSYSLLMLMIQVVFVIVWCIAAFGFATNSFQVSKYYHGTTYNLEECTSYKYYSNIEIDQVSLQCSSGATCYACLCHAGGGNMDVISSTSECFKPRFYWPAFVFLAISLFWTNAVIANVVHCTASSAVWKWWCTGECSEDEVKESFQTMTSYSLGSICFGSLLAALVRTLRGILALMHHDAAQRRERYRQQHTDHQPYGSSLSNLSFSGFIINLNYYAAVILEHIVTLLDRAIVYFNRYALCLVGMEGLDYMTASKTIVTLFQNRGLSAILNDDLIDTLLMLSNFMIAFLSMAIAYIYTKSTSKLSLTYVYLLTIFGFFCGYVMSTVLLSVISSSVTTVYVAFARNPRKFEEIHPELYIPLAAAWNKIFPGCLSAANQQIMEEEFGGDCDNDFCGSSSSGPIRGTYNPPNSATLSESDGVAAEVSPSNRDANQDDASNRQTKKSVSWGTSVLQMVNISPLGFGFRTDNTPSSHVVKGSYQQLSPAIIRDDGSLTGLVDDNNDEMGQSSVFIGNNHDSFDNQQFRL